MANSEQRERMESTLRVYLKSDQLSLPRNEQIEQLRKKKRKQGWFLIINIIAILFFSYSFLYGITQLSNTILYILFAVFAINMVLIIYQRKQLGELIDYLVNKSAAS